MKKTIEVRSIGKRNTGCGHWFITVETWDGQTFQETTTDSQAIDSWDEETENYPESGANVLAERILRNNGITDFIFNFQRF